MNKRLIQAVREQLLERVELEERDVHDLVLDVMESANGTPLSSRDVHLALKRASVGYHFRTIQRVIQDLLEEDEIVFVGKEKRTNRTGGAQRVPVYRRVE